MFAVICTMLTSLDEKHFVVLQVVGFAVFVVCHVLFMIVEHHVEEQSRSDDPVFKVEKADATWR